MSASSDRVVYNGGTTARWFRPAPADSGVYGRLLELAEPSPAWMGAAHAGHLTLPDGSIQPIVALLGPEHASPDALSRSRRAAALALTLRHPGILRLHHVAGWKGRVAWCYEEFDGVCLSRLAEIEGTALPARAAAELVAQVAEVLIALGPAGLEHAGPELPDLLLSASGRVRIAGFAGPFPSSPAMRAPNSDKAGSAAVYRLGVLLAVLISGASPVAGVDATAHNIIVRRALIRAMSRPGPVLSERYGQWVRGMLAWASSERPPLSTVPSGLRAVAWATGGEGIAEWSARNVPDVLHQVFERADVPVFDDAGDSWAVDVSVQNGPPPKRRPVSEDAFVTRSQADDRGFVSPIPRPRPLDDDPTQEATLRPDGMFSEPPSVPPMDSDSSLIPVNIGPPAEIVARRPSLPPGFLDQDKPRSSGEELLVSVSGIVEPKAGTAPVVLVIIVCLGVIAIAALAYLLLGGPARPVPATMPTGPGLSIQVEQPVPAAPHTPAEGWIAPDFAETDTDDAMLDDDMVDSDVPAVAEVAAVPPVRGPRTKPQGHSVLFRLASGQPGKISVRCDGGARSAGVGQVRLFGLKDEWCLVTTVSPDGKKLSHPTEIKGPATIDCFHDWQAVCLD